MIPSLPLVAPPYFQMVAAFDHDQGIGLKNAIPWRVPGDMRQFRELTQTTIDSHKQNAVIMGRNTWDSLPEKFKPLPRRVNAVLSRQQHLSLPQDVRHAASLDSLLSELRDSTSIEQVFVIGGAQIYQQGILSPLCKRLWLTTIEASFKCDTFFPAFSDWHPIHRGSPQHYEGLQYHLTVYERSVCGE